MSKVKAFELDVAAAGYTGGEAVHFGGFPGLWVPGRPVALSELGFNAEKDARDTAAALGLPLREVSVDAGSAPMPVRPNHASSDLAPEPEPETVPAPAAASEPEAEEAE